MSPPPPNVPPSDESYSANRSAEQHAVVRRRSTTLALCGLFCGFLGLGLLLTKTIAVDHPPAVFAVNLSFCAMMIGIGILFYARGTNHVRVAITASLLAIASGIVGPLIYARQAMFWHLAVENRELGNAQAIATSALAYARRHHGNYPPSLFTLLNAGDISLQNLNSPFGSMQRLADQQRMAAELSTLQLFRQIESVLPVRLPLYTQTLSLQLAKEVDTLSDYQYFGAGLRLPKIVNPKSPPTLPEEIIITTSLNAIMSRQMTVAFADGHSVFLDESKAESALLTSNDTRAALGFPPIRPPEVLTRAEKQTTPTAEKN